MEQSKIISTAIKINHLTNLNTYLLNQNGELMYHHEMIAIPLLCQVQKIMIFCISSKI